MSPLEIGGEAPLAPGCLAEAAHGRREVRLHADALARIGAAHEAMCRAAAAGAKIYGVTTGLGAVVDTSVAADDPERQRRIVLARAVGVGKAATATEVRAVMIARLAGLARGVSGASVPTVEAYAAMLAAGIVPVVPLTGSLGEADLAPLAHIAAVLVGAGEAWIGGERLAGEAALAQAGLRAATLAPKDGLALVSSNACSTGLGALALADARHALAVLVEAAALSFEAQQANPTVLRADIVALHAAPGQARIAGALRARLAGGALAKAGSGRRLHDPLSFRCAVPVLGALAAAIEAADAAVAFELAHSDDNPAVLADGTVAGTASFDATHLALAFEALGQAIARAAAITGARIMQLMRAETTGLPRFLTPREGGRSGLAPLQKTVSSLVAEIAHAASPLPATVLAVADGLEDVATMAVPIVRKTARAARMLATLAAAELITAAQAIDLRAGTRLGAGTSHTRAQVRAAVATLDEDRSVAADLVALEAAMEEWRLDAGTE